MNEKTKQFLEDNAERILKFRNLDSGTQELVVPLLNKAIQSMLRILDLIAEAEDGMTYEAIADEIGQNATSIAQRLNSLSKGGYPIILSDYAAWEDPSSRFHRKLKTSVKTKTGDE
ncbi:MAG: helix-turn-helix domain-containing protein [Roseofilum sp. SID3]|uniref:helix-turn-helix domain-containing protein n=1 Tax=Roseofilum sp. SID3 TaxID=2821499 RepID=UPI001B1350BA|nr:helix-turn-helix domain-containing protein [Roseofilum sp. SID3]MBP0015315.1 helix-turn-helix domain-containing protein [Roseofilum sp. SID3]